MRKLLLALLLVIAPAIASAQVVERPEPFDSAGRVPVVTPLIAARLQLGPPAWRITGDYREAKLYAMGNAGWVIVVTRRTGEVERYSITAADRDYLRARTATLPPGLAEQIAASVRETVREGIPAPTSARTSFIINQSLLGLTVYAPSFAAAVTNEPAGRAATYLLVAGGTYFAAASLSRDIPISMPQNVLATTAALRGGAAGYGVAYALDASNDGKAAGIFMGSLAGTAAGLFFGQRMTSADAMAASFGADALTLTMAGALRAAGTLDRESEGGNRRAAAAALVTAGLAGFPLGARYAKAKDYNVTAGDVGTLWVAGGIGTLAAATVIEAVDARDDAAIYLGLTGGFLGGVVAGDRLLVKRFDHSFGDAGTVLAGAAAGALMGAGVSVLATGDGDNDALTLGLATAGAIAGVGVSDWLISTPADARGYRTGMRLRLDATGLALAASGVPGRHPLVSLTF